MAMGQSLPLEEPAEENVLPARPKRHAKSTRDFRRQKRRLNASSGHEVPIVGVEHRIWMTKHEDPTKGYKNHSGIGPKDVDSFVHRFGRTVGFKDRDSPAEPVTDPKILQAKRRSKLVLQNPKSYPKRAYAQGSFECYCLSQHPNSPYTAFLKLIQSCNPSLEDQVVCQHPDAALLECYMWHLHDDPASPDPLAPPNSPPGRMLKASGIDAKLKYISSTTKEFGAGLMIRSEKMVTLLADWGESEDVAAANPFDVEDDLPRLWDHLWTMKLPHYKKVSLWSCFLVQLATIGRASDVCEAYCPLMKHVSLPSNPDDWYDDGTPVFIELVWTDWKARPRKQRKAPYFIRVYSNPHDLRFCPVHWLQNFWTDRRARREKGLERPAEDDDPILAKIAQKTYTNHCMMLFDGVELDCTPHSIRRTGAQWASQCGMNLQVIRNVGRWTDIKNMFLYVAEGRQLHNIKQANSSTSQDGIFQFWVFNAKTAVSSMPMSADLLNSLAPAMLRQALA
jgi:hypothetical protein